MGAHWKHATMRVITSAASVLHVFLSPMVAFEVAGMQFMHVPSVLFPPGFLVYYLLTAFYRQQMSLIGELVKSVRLRHHSKFDETRFD